MIEDITLHDFGAGGHPGSEEFRASGQTPHIMAAAFKVLEQPPTDVPCGPSKQDQGRSICRRREERNSASEPTTSAPREVSRLRSSTAAAPPSRMAVSGLRVLRS